MKRFKRIAALLLALSMLAAAGCAENPADTSSGTEGSESSSGAESSDPNPFVEPEVNEIRDTINALYGNAPTAVCVRTICFPASCPNFPAPSAPNIPATAAGR